jgi:nucleobase:cation symporter-1, NCS1 family
VIERRSIDWVPDSERHGRLASVGAIWFLGNLNPVSIAVGITGLVLGGNLVWVLIANLAGVLVGTLFMAFHSAQGPQMGIPQMVQSRPQFGYVGAALTVWIFVMVNYTGYNVFNNVLGGESVHNVASGLPVEVGYALVTLCAVTLAIWGYDWIHRTNSWCALAFLPILVILTIGAAATLSFPGGAWDLGEFEVAAIMAQFAISASYQLGWAPYVSDYSRYLPSNVSVRQTFWWTYLPSAASATWAFAIGALVVAPDTDVGMIEALRSAGDDIFDGFGTIVLVFGLIGLITVSALNLYGGALTLISAADSVRPRQPTRAHRVVATLIVAAVALVLAFFAADNFESWYANFLVLLLYLFVPWTAVNLVDYYIVRRGRYSIAEIFNPAGVYGRIGWRGIGAYAIGFAAMIPFMSSTAFEGPIAKEVSDIDLAMFVGLPVASIAYIVLCRGLDVDAELRAATEREGEEGAVLVGEP